MSRTKSNNFKNNKYTQTKLISPKTPKKKNQYQSPKHPKELRNTYSKSNYTWTACQYINEKKTKLKTSLYTTKLNKDKYPKLKCTCATQIIKIGKQTDKM